MIYRYNKCTNTQRPTFNLAPFPGDDAYELQILPNGDVLVADSESVVLLDPNGNLIRLLLVAASGCADELFAIAVDPGGTSFWTDDTSSGDRLPQSTSPPATSCRPSTPSPYLYGLSVDNEIEVAAPPPTTTTVPSTSDHPARHGQLLHPDAGLGRADQIRAPNAHRQRAGDVFTLNGSETCTATTDATGTATCDHHGDRALEHLHADRVLPG